MIYTTKGELFRSKFDTKLLEHNDAKYSESINHKMFIKGDGVYAYGNNKNGQCGLKICDFIYEPKKVLDGKFVKVISGKNTSYVISANGALYFAGYNAKYARIGIHKVFVEKFTPCNFFTSGVKNVFIHKNQKFNLVDTTFSPKIKNICPFCFKKNGLFWFRCKNNSILCNECAEKTFCSCNIGGRKTRAGCPVNINYGHYKALNAMFARKKKYFHDTVFSS